MSGFGSLISPGSPCDPWPLVWFKVDFSFRVSSYCESRGWKRIYNKHREDFKLKWCETKSPANYRNFREGPVHQNITKRVKDNCNSESQKWFFPFLISFPIKKCNVAEKKLDLLMCCLQVNSCCTRFPTTRSSPLRSASSAACGSTSESAAESTTGEDWGEVHSCIPAVLF